MVLQRIGDSKSRVFNGFIEKFILRSSREINKWTAFHFSVVCSGHGVFESGII